jgi:hypothetical protein
MPPIETKFVIIGGPDRMELVYSMVFMTKTTFAIQPVNMIPIQALDVTISSIELESGSGHSWNLRGNVLGGGPGSTFTAYYKTKSRDPRQSETGTLSIFSEGLSSEEGQVQTEL